MNSLRLPEGWYASGSHLKDYDIGVDPEVTWKDRLAVSIVSKDGDTSGTGGIRQTVLAESFLGRRVRYSAQVRTVNVADRAGLFLLVEGHRWTQIATIACDTMENRPIRGNMDWGPYAVILDVPKESVSMHFGILLTGPGGVWMSDVAIEAVPADTPVTAKPLYDPTPLAPSNLSFAD